MRVVAGPVAEESAPAMSGINTIQPPAEPFTDRAAFRDPTIAAPRDGLPTAPQEVVIDPLVEPNKRAPDVAHTASTCSAVVAASRACFLAQLEK